MTIGFGARTAWTAGVLIMLAHGAAAQATKKPKVRDSVEIKTRDSTRIPPLFTSERPLPVTFTTNLKQLRGDKGEEVPWRSATMTYTAADGKSVTVPLRAKTHGVWRLRRCDFPPVRLNVSNKESKGTLFHDLDKPKLTNYCRDNTQHEQYVLQEFQLYRIYQLLTPISHKVRLLHVTYADSADQKPLATRYAFLFEDPDQLGARLGGLKMRVKGASADDIDPAQGALVYVFEYFIGNTDFSFNGLHNGEIFSQTSGDVMPVAYDFDFSGAVNAHYASVDPSLSVKRVRQRLFRGYCVWNSQYPAAFDVFRKKKDAIYALYRDEIGALMDPKIVKETLEYFDEFYETINDAGSADRMLRSCVGPR